MKIYHYSSVDSWRDIKKGSWMSGGQPGLGASRRVCTANFESPGARAGAVFGLLEPEPDSWVNNTEFPVAWSALMGNVGRLLLAYEPSDEIVGNSFVIDWSHRERVLGGHKDDLGSSSGDGDREIRREDRIAAEKAYWASRVSLADCVDYPEVLAEIALPEVITMCNVPFTSIEIADIQPRLQNMPNFVKEDLFMVIERNSELGVLSAHIT